MLKIDTRTGTYVSRASNAAVEAALRDEDWRPTCSIETLVARSQTLASIRAFFAQRGVLEVDTPVLSRTTVTDPAIESLSLVDGGERRYLQTSPEYQMKRLLAAGAPSMVRIGPVFRAEESGRLHNPEFTMIEWYRLGFDLAAADGRSRRARRSRARRGNAVAP